MSDNGGTSTDGHFSTQRSSRGVEGANCIMSMFDYFFEHCGLKETIVQLHADKVLKNTMIHYLLCRVMTGTHKEITLAFTIAGHTKLLDWCFGLFKLQFRKTKVDCLADISNVTRICSPGGLTALRNRRWKRHCYNLWLGQSPVSKLFAVTTINTKICSD